MSNVQKKVDQSKNYREVKKNSCSSPNSNDSASEQPTAKMPTVADLERLKKCVGETWTGKCKWFNVSKGFGFVVPDSDEFKNDDVFVHQVIFKLN